MTDLSVYTGENEDVVKMRETIQRLMPGGTRLTPEEAESVANVAMAHGLDPFNGEVWGLKNPNNGKWYGVMVGIKGLRKHARNQMVGEEGSYWTEFIKVMPSKYGEPDNSIVYECILRDTTTNNAYTQSLHNMTQTGMPYDIAVKGLGPMPKVIGVGIYRNGEKTMMKPDAVAKKRAEADAIKQRFNVDFAQVNPDMLEQPDTFSDAPVLVDRSEPVDEKQLLADLGFVEDDVVEGELVEDDSEFANLKTPKGTLFNDLDVEQLGELHQYYSGKIEDLKQAGVDDSNADTLAMYQFKLEGVEHYMEVFANAE